MVGRWVRRVALTAVALLVVGYGGLCAWFYAKQDTFIYPGATVEVEPAPSPVSVGLDGFEAITLRTPDGQQLVAWWHPPADGRGVVLYLHGNRHSLALDTRVERLRDITATGMGAMGIEYRGFGGSSGTPSEAGLITDAETAYDEIARRAPGAKIALFGESLGTGVAVALATQRPVAGVALDSPYASILRLADGARGWLPNGLLLRSPWNSLSRITAINAPLFIAHCDADRTIPLAEGERLFAAAREPKAMRVLPDCGHIEVWREPVKGALLADFLAWTTP